MKNLLSAILFTTCTFAMAQPGFEHSYGISTSICHLEKSGDKYFAMDVSGKKCMVYNMDHTLYRSIDLSVPLDYYLYNIQFVSEHTFNKDDLIEFVYIYSKYNQTETSYYYSYETRVINENGVEILKIPGAGHTEILDTENNGRKFLLYVYDFSQVPATTQTQVYSLPEDPLKSGPIQNRYKTGNPWPNPTRGMVNIPVKLPPGKEKGWLILYNIHGKEVMRHEVNGDEELVVLPGGLLIPGTYLYKMKSGKDESKGRKISIQ